MYLRVEEEDRHEKKLHSPNISIPKFISTYTCMSHLASKRKPSQKWEACIMAVF